MKKIRLQKFLADAGLMSRRAAEAEFILELEKVPDELGNELDGLVATAEGVISVRKVVRVVVGLGAFAELFLDLIHDVDVPSADPRVLLRLVIQRLHFVFHVP